jgi:hypothetical protein
MIVMRRTTNLKNWLVIIALLLAAQYALGPQAHAGSVVGWGSNFTGQIDVPDGNDFVAVAAGAYHSIALKADGSIVGWGDNWVGQATPPSTNDFVDVGGISTTVYWDDGNTPWVGEDIMVGTKLTIIVSSNVPEWLSGGSLAIADANRDYGVLSARGTEPYYLDSCFPAAGTAAVATTWFETGIAGFDMYVGDEDVNVGDWFIIDYTATTVGTCKVGFYDHDVSWVDPVYYLEFTHVNVPEPLEAGIEIYPRTLNLKSKGKWISCKIWLPEDCDVTDVNSYSIFLEDEIPSDWIWFDEEQQVIMAKFSRSTLQQILADSETPAEVELLVSGALTDGTVFEGTDTIRVIGKGPTPQDARWKGQVSSVTTADYIVVDNFDSYDSNTSLWAVWNDYWTNGSGGEIFLEEDVNIVRGGNSLQLDYQSLLTKCGSIGSGMDASTTELGRGSDSTIECGVIGSWMDASTTELGCGSDWTTGGVKALVLYFRGTAGNDLDQMWVELEDTSSNVGYVLYDGDINDVTVEQWQEWNIDLSVFDACGVSLTNIDNVYIGIGGEDKTGRKESIGTIYLDDIRLYPSRCVFDIAHPPADLSENCIVDLPDLEIMAQEWLTAGVKADLVDDDIVNFKDFDVLADNWLAEQLWP